MSTKSREVIFGSRIAGAKIRAQGALERATEAVREADRAEAEAWSIRMEGYGRPAQPSPTIGQCQWGLGWLHVKCHRCKTEPASRSTAFAAEGYTDLEARGVVHMIRLTEPRQTVPYRLGASGREEATAPVQAGGFALGDTAPTHTHG